MQETPQPKKCEICATPLTKENHTVSYDLICDKCATSAGRSMFF